MQWDWGYLCAFNSIYSVTSVFVPVSPWDNVSHLRAGTDFLLEIKTVILYSKNGDSIVIHWWAESQQDHSDTHVKKKKKKKESRVYHRPLAELMD